MDIVQYTFMLSSGGGKILLNGEFRSKSVQINTCGTNYFKKNTSLTSEMVSKLKQKLIQLNCGSNQCPHSCLPHLI